MTVEKVSFDFIIAGGGLCGCVLASKLKQISPQLSIALIEAGSNDLGNPDIYLPAFDSLNSPYTYKNLSVKQSELNNREVLTLTGRTVSGGSTVNYGGWTRGNSADYDEWANLVGDPRWSYEKLLPYFKNTETYHDQESNKEQHGFNGPIHTTTGQQFPLAPQIRKSFEQRGLKYIADMNSGSPNGISKFVQNWVDGQRQPAGKAYGLDGINVVENSVVQRVILEEKNGQMTAIGVELHDQRQLFATKEVIVSCGTMRSPQVLMLSGIGPKEELAKVQLPLKIDLPVGHNYHDHPIMCLEFKLKEYKDGQLMGSPGFMNNPKNFQGLPIDYLVSEPTPDEVLIEAAVIDGDKPKLGKHTSIEYIISYLAGAGNYGPVKIAENDGQHFSVGVALMDPTSRGTINLRSKNAEDYPVLDPKYFTTEHDRACFRAGIRQALRTFEDTQAGQEFVEGEVAPKGYPKLNSKSSDDDLDKRRSYMTASCFHPAGTCAMGSVIDSKCRVYGVNQLRVVDASILPIPLTAHIQAPLYAISESMADLILKEK